jgi:hypothetical protein
MSGKSFMNCPSGKHIDDHFGVQLEQLGIKPLNQEDHRELMDILNRYLSYPDDELANNHRIANKLGLLDIEAELRARLAESGGMSAETKNRMQ